MKILISMQIRYDVEEIELRNWLEDFLVCACDLSLFQFPIYNMSSDLQLVPVYWLKHKNGRKSYNLGFMYNLPLHCVEALQMKKELGRKALEPLVNIRM